jgi:ribulose-phosphate 3-epimerase
MVQETFEVQTIPAIIPESFDDLREKLARVAELVSVVQIDVCDGKLTPKPSWPYKAKDIAEGVFEAFIKEQEGLPFWDRLNYEIDLMVKHPEEEAEKWIMAGAFRLIFHKETIENDALAALMQSVRARGVEVVVALDALDPLDDIMPFVAQVDGIQFMGIDREGFQGEEFDTKVLEKIILLRNAHPELHISVDGGVNLDTAPAIIEAGADRLVAGSAIFESESVEDALNDFENLLY